MSIQRWTCWADMWRGHPEVVWDDWEDGEWVKAADHEAALAEATKPRTLTADDPEPAVGSVVLDEVVDAWQRRGDLWHMAGDLDGPLEWAELLSMYGPLRLIHDGGQ